MKNLTLNKTCNAELLTKSLRLLVIFPILLLLNKKSNSFGICRFSVSKKDNSVKNFRNFTYVGQERTIFSFNKPTKWPNIDFGPLE